MKKTMKAKYKYWMSKWNKNPFLDFNFKLFCFGFGLPVKENSHYSIYFCFCNFFIIISDRIFRRVFFELVLDNSKGYLGVSNLTIFFFRLRINGYWQF